jgi:hypothetical protein
MLSRRFGFQLSITVRQIGFRRAATENARKKKLRGEGRGNSEEDKSEKRRIKRKRAEFRICKLSNKIIEGGRCTLHTYPFKSFIALE